MFKEPVRAQNRSSAINQPKDVLKKQRSSKNPTRLDINSPTDIDTALSTPSIDPNHTDQTEKTTDDQTSKATKKTHPTISSPS